VAVVCYTLYAVNFNMCMLLMSEEYKLWKALYDLKALLYNYIWKALLYIFTQYVHWVLSQ
jgi:hypothetical protein